MVVGGPGWRWKHTSASPFAAAVQHPSSLQVAIAGFRLVLVGQADGNVHEHAIPVARHIDYLAQALGDAVAILPSLVDRHVKPPFLAAIDAPSKRRRGFVASAYGFGTTYRGHLVQDDGRLR